MRLLGLALLVALVMTPARGRADCMFGEDFVDNFTIRSEEACIEACHQGSCEKLEECADAGDETLCCIPGRQCLTRIRVRLVRCMHACRKEEGCDRIAGCISICRNAAAQGIPDCQNRLGYSRGCRRKANQAFAQCMKSCQKPQPPSLDCEDGECVCDVGDEDSCIGVFGQDL